MFDNNDENQQIIPTRPPRFLEISEVFNIINALLFATSLSIGGLRSGWGLFGNAAFPVGFDRGSYVFWCSVGCVERLHRETQLVFIDSTIAGVALQIVMRTTKLEFKHLSRPDTEPTVHTHISNIFKKLGAKNRREALVKARRIGAE